MGWGSSTSTPSQLQIGGLLVTKAARIASEMNHFFLDKVRQIRNQMTPLPNDFSKCHEIMRGKRCKFGLNFVSVAKVKRLLKRLKKSRSISTDGLDNFCIRVSAEIIAEPLHHIITLSIMQRKFPHNWKYCKVIPPLKKIFQT